MIGLWSGSMEGNGDSSGNPVVWFEVIGKDAGGLRTFYADLFGWKFDLMEGMDYGMVSADANGGGIPGGIGAGPDPSISYQTVYAGVDDVDGALAKAESLGAKTVAPPRSPSAIRRAWRTRSRSASTSSGRRRRSAGACS